MGKYRITTEKQNSNYQSNMFEIGSEALLGELDFRKQSKIYIDTVKFQENSLKNYPSLNSIETIIDLENGI